MASVDDVRRAAERAAEAQREWARMPLLARAAVLPQAAQLWQENAGELVDWIVRESGAIGPFAGFQLHVAESECCEAAAQAGSTIPVDVNFMLNGRRMVESPRGTATRRASSQRSSCCGSRAVSQSTG
ncbi:MAG TPA: aldehyde dehydrogenase family protein [Candidatus Dormibacteraeota bacterium]|nr:aldehyde dehydrogenase family protein [Candidatus Dormibacteraeota bacterium]